MIQFGQVLGSTYGKMNEAVGMKNRLTVYWGGKRLVCTLKRQEFWNCIGCVLLEVTYVYNMNEIWSEIPKCFSWMAPIKIKRDVCVITDLYQVYCYHYCHFISMIAIELFYIKQLCSFLGFFFGYLPPFDPYRFTVYP